MVVESDAGIVCSVMAPEWISWLGASDFVGRELDSLGEFVEERVGPVTNEWVISPMHGVVVLAVQVTTESETRFLRAYRLVDADSGKQRVYLIDASREHS